MNDFEQAKAEIARDFLWVSGRDLLRLRLLGRAEGLLKEMP